MAQDTFSENIDIRKCLTKKMKILIHIKFFNEIEQSDKVILNER